MIMKYQLETITIVMFSIQGTSVLNVFEII